MDLRNIAIIAHVDHGKTTLVDALLKQSSNFKIKADAPKELIMDSNELERERGITIFSKNASIEYRGTKINIIDTPGHADFGGEVERVLNMADGSLLLVDAQEGPMPQTRFVLKRALSLGHKIIVVINKIDKPNARINYTLEKILELFIDLGANDEQVEFPVIYAAGKIGKAGRTPDLASMTDCGPLFEAIHSYIPPPIAHSDNPLQMMIIAVRYDNYKGRVGIGRVYSGRLSAGMPVAIIPHEGPLRKGKITDLMTFAGLDTVEISTVEAGDIAAIAGIPDITIGETVTSKEYPATLPPIMIEKPTVKMIFSVNDSPFAGREGDYCTSRNLKERLMKELESDIALRVEPGASPDEFVVNGRGELHLAILIEKMRREGYELQVSRPEVIFKEEDGRTTEPAEDAWIEVPEQYSGNVIEMMSSRKGKLKNMHVENGVAMFHFFIPTRGLIGFRNEFIMKTKGRGILNSLYAGYFPKWEHIETNPHGSLVIHEAGTTTAYGLLNAQERGVLFVKPATPVYKGQVAGENAKSGDITVNVCKEKQLTNFRSKTEQVTDDLVPPRILSLEQALEYIGDDELVEATPKSIRIRKMLLTENERKKARRG
ncbi:MAG: GTP-binding protein TypA [Parcubacteria group bacterium RIFCSPLOWO2_01_FULL_48_18]|nr:MAG: GTP-binding protein TypA [Parcubacteria group bacterium RIFCSPLOWO2_01_FULL_48_18]